MKKLVKITAGMLFCAILLSANLFSQDESKEEFKSSILSVTTIHWNLDKTDGSMEEWNAIEKEYHEKVTMKNDLILHSNFLNHYFTADNSEAKAITLFGSLEDIDKAGDRTAELIKEGWPVEAERDAFFKVRNSYFTSMHSDEVYNTLPGGVFMEETPEDPMVYYVRKSHLAFPEDGSNDAIKAMNEEYLENVIYKNEYIKGYYPSRHYYGSDSRDFIEVFVVNSLADIEASFDKTTELTNAHWPDEEARKAFFKEYDKYFSGWHADYIYRNVPGLAK